MDMILNIIPDGVRNIHMTAICGTGMGSLACMLSDMGYRLSGSDQNVYPPMSTFLEERGIPVSLGFREANIPEDADLVIIGNAVRRDNPEVRELARRRLNFCSMPQAINRFMAEGRQPVLVTGTHGKTTTSSIMAWIFESSGFDPSFLIGGIVRNFGGGCRLGSGPHIVLEGDEYDTAFFDKGSKFLHYDPAITILTSVEFDHADIFRDLDHVKQSFQKLLSGLKPDSLLLAFDGDANISDLLSHARCRIQRYGSRPGSPWRLANIVWDAPWTRFDIFKKHHLFGRFKTRMIGQHNLLNALAAVASADDLGISAEAVGNALETFQGTKRRQEIRGCCRGITVMDDFAHHPTAVRETVRAVKSSIDGGRLIAVFEPRTNSSMRQVFQDVYPQAFDHADIICIRKPPLLHKIPEGERFSSETLVQDLKARGKSAFYFSETEPIIDFIVDKGRAGDLVLVMSNGGFDNIHERLLNRLESS